MLDKPMKLHKPQRKLAPRQELLTSHWFIWRAFVCPKDGFQFASDDANVCQMPVLSNNGLTAHQDFPVAPYEAVHTQVGSRWSQEASYFHYAGAWNALAYRFHGAVDAGARFQRSLKDFGAHPAPHQRYQQEEALFNFFSNGFAAFEAMFYGLFAVGSFIDPQAFL